MDTKDYRVFPVEFVSDWPNRATTDPPDHWALDDLRIETSGLLVIDLDNHGGADGLAAWDALGFVSSPASTTSASGTGRHLYWRLPDDMNPQDVRCSAGYLAPGVDVRSWHGNAKETAAAFASLPPRGDLPLAPRALLTAVQRVDVAQTTEGRTDGPTAPALHPWVASAVRARCDEVAAASVGNNANDVQTSAARRLVLLANNPASGLTATDAYSAYRDACTAAGAWDDKAEYRWTSAANKYAHEMAHVPNDENTGTDAYSEDVAKEYLRLKVRQDAERQLASETYHGTQDLNWDDLFEFRDDDWLVEDFIGRGSVNFLIARPNLGKTFAYLDMICRGSVGMDSWLGRAVSPFRTVVYVSEGSKMFGARVLAWCRLNDRIPQDATRHLWVKAGANIASDIFTAKLAADCDTHRPDLIVFDTFSGTSGVQDENAAALIGITLQRVRAVAPQASVLFVHHPSKESENTTAPRSRGSGALFGAADTVMTMYEDRHFDGEQDTYLALSTDHAHAGKSRDAVSRTIQGLYLSETQVGARPSGDAVMSCAMQWDTSTTYTKADRAVREYLTVPMSTTEFADAAGISAASARRYLRDSAFAVIVETGKGASPDRWALAA